MKKDVRRTRIFLPLKGKKILKPGETPVVPGKANETLTLSDKAGETFALPGWTIARLQEREE